MVIMAKNDQVAEAIRKNDEVVNLEQDIINHCLVFIKPIYSRVKLVKKIFDVKKTVRVLIPSRKIVEEGNTTLHCDRF